MINQKLHGVHHFRLDVVEGNGLVGATVEAVFNGEDVVIPESVVDFRSGRKDPVRMNGNEPRFSGFVD